MIIFNILANAKNMFKELACSSINNFFGHCSDDCEEICFDHECDSCEKTNICQPFGCECKTECYPCEFECDAKCPCRCKIHVNVCVRCDNEEEEEEE